jgi:hypothetical protein
MTGYCADCGNQQCICDEIAAGDGMSDTVASSQCPICSVDTPHEHSGKEVYAYHHGQTRPRRYITRGRWVFSDGATRYDGDGYSAEFVSVSDYEASQAENARLKGVNTMQTEGLAKLDAENAALRAVLRALLGEKP